MEKKLIYKNIIVVIIIFVLTMSVGFKSMAQTIQEIQDAKKKIDQQQQTIKEDTAEIEAQKKAAAVEIQAEWKKYNDLQAQIKKYEDTIDGYEDEIAKTEKQFLEKQEMLKKRLRYVYEQQGNPYLNAILNSKSIAEMLDKAYLTSLMVKDTKNLTNEVKALKEDIVYKKSVIEGEKKKISEKAIDKEVGITKLKEVNQSLETQITKNDKKYEQLQSEEERLQQELSKELVKLQNKNQKYNGGAMTWPLPSSRNITSSYSNRINPISKRAEFHTGLDISAPSGSTIVAASGGKVINSSVRSGYGNLVVIDHGSGISTYYAHCSKLLVKVGDSVKAGNVIAKVGSTGYSTGPHLHFEVRINGTPKNPNNYL